MTLHSIFQFVALATILAFAVYWDLSERRIPNLVTVPGLVAGLFFSALAEGGFPVQGVSGAGIALVVSFPLVLLGGLGAGDAKLFTTVGAFVGIGGLFSVFLFGGLAGGILALINAVRRGAILGVLANVMNMILYHLTLGRHGVRIRLDSPGAHSVPYGLAIAAGALGAWFFPLSLGGTL